MEPSSNNTYRDNSPQPIIDGTVFQQLTRQPSIVSQTIHRREDSSATPIISAQESIQASTSSSISSKTKPTQRLADKVNDTRLAVACAAFTILCLLVCRGTTLFIDYYDIKLDKK